MPIPYYDTYIITNATGMDTVYFLSEFMLVFMFARMYFLVKSCLNYNQFMNPYAKKLCKAYGFEQSVLFTIKSNIQINPEKTVSYLFILTLFLFAYVVRVFEMPRFRLDEDDRFDSYFNSIWFTVITLTTIGYGDISPLTIPGKLTTIILAFWGAVLMALIVVVLYKVFDLSEDEQMALSHVELTETAAETIKKSMQYFIAKKKSQMLKLKAGKTDDNSSKFINNLKNIKPLRVPTYKRGDLHIEDTNINELHSKGSDEQGFSEVDIKYISDDALNTDTFDRPQRMQINQSNRITTASSKASTDKN